MRITSPLGMNRGGAGRPVFLTWTAALAALLAAGPWVIDQVGLAEATATDPGATTFPAGAACDPAWLPTFGGAPGVAP
jgi:hypothetical protein